MYQHPKGLTFDVYLNDMLTLMNGNLRKKVDITSGNVYIIYMYQLNKFLKLKNE